MELLRSLAITGTEEVLSISGLILLLAACTPDNDPTTAPIRWCDGDYHLDAWPLDATETSDPRKFMLLGQRWRTMALTSLSWLLPVELSADGARIEAIHYDRAITPRADHQCATSHIQKNVAPVERELPCERHADEPRGVQLIRRAE